MTITFVAATAAEATSLTMPSHALGDRLFLHVGREGSATAPTPPASSDWILVSFTSGNNIFISLWTKLAQSSSETSGTWTNATFIGCCVYRSSMFVMPGFALGSGGTAGSGDNTVWNTNFRASPMIGDRWGIATIQHRSNDTDIETAPSGYTFRCGVAGVSAGEFAMFDTDGVTAATSGPSRTLTAGTSAQYRAIIGEVLETQYTIGGGGGGIQTARGMHGGMR